MRWSILLFTLNNIGPLFELELSYRYRVNSEEVSDVRWVVWGPLRINWRCTRVSWFTMTIKRMKIFYLPDRGKACQNIHKMTLVVPTCYNRRNRRYSYSTAMSRMDAQDEMIFHINWHPHKKSPTIKQKTRKTWTLNVASFFFCSQSQFLLLLL